jgi:hypothetical protein
MIEGETWISEEAIMRLYFIPDGIQYMFHFLVFGLFCFPCFKFDFFAGNFFGSAEEPLSTAAALFLFSWLVPRAGSVAFLVGTTMVTDLVFFVGAVPPLLEFFEDSG